MSGIAGIISNSFGSKIKIEELQTFASCLAINKCTQNTTLKISESAIVALGELAGRPMKKYTSPRNSYTLLVWGDIFSSGTGNPNMDDLFEIICREWDSPNSDFRNCLTGFYIILMFDLKSNRVSLFNCKFGMMPLYYLIDSHILYFSSRLQSFIDLRKINFTLNKCALLQYLVFNYSIDDSTFVQRVKLLPAASTITNEFNCWNVNKYDNHNWLFDKPVQNYKVGSEAVNNALYKAISNIASVEDNFGCSITGGWDGRLVLSYLSRMNANKFFLYTYGRRIHPDMGIAIKLSKEFGFDHLPVYLEDEFTGLSESLADQTLDLSGGIRAANRSHYLYMAKMLGERTRLVISGNCGSNILKIIQGPGPAYNEFVLSLFKNTDSLEDKANSVYLLFFTKYPWVKKFVPKDEFVSAINNSEINTEESISSGSRFYHFLLTNSERKYFAAETSSYSSYIYNYSPFIESDFIRTLVKTPYYGGHYNFLETNPVVRYKLSKLYAELMVANNPDLAKFTSDRGFPITWFLSPFGRYAGFIKKHVTIHSQKKSLSDPFNQKVGFDRIFNKWDLRNEFFDIPKDKKITENLIKAYSWSHWSEEYFGK